MTRRDRAGFGVVVAVGLVILGGDCSCHSAAGLVSTLQTPTDGGNEVTCDCTCFVSGSCDDMCGNSGSAACPATFGGPSGPIPNCLSLTSKICLPPDLNPQLPTCDPRVGCGEDPDSFCKDQCQTWGNGLASLFGDPCVLGSLVHGIDCRHQSHAVPAAPGGPLDQDFAACNTNCPVVPCTVSNVTAGIIGGSLLCTPDAGESSCCTALSTCAGPSAPICAPVVDSVGLLGEMQALASVGQLDPGSAITLSSSGADAGTQVTGKLTVLGRPCADGNCSVGVGFQLLPGDVTTSGLSLTNVQLNGNTMTPGSVTLSGGMGPLDVTDLDVTAVATASGCAFSLGPICLFSVNGTQAIEEKPQAQTAGMTPPMLSVDFTAHTFSLTGTFDFAGDSADNIPAFSLSANVFGKLLNEPPSANAGPAQSLECTSPQGTLVTLDGSGSSDPDDNLSVFSWHLGDPLFGPPVGGTAVVQTEAPFNGTGATATTYGLTVLDTFGQMDQALTQVTVMDTQPPVIESITANPRCLWPPNHKLVLLRIGNELQVSDHDTCDSSPAVFIKNVQDSQPFLGGGSGNTTPDFVFGPGAVCLRSERDGTQSSPRIYTVTLAVVDHAGNEADEAIQIAVPHDQGQGSCPSVPDSDFVGDGDPACLAGLDGGLAPPPSPQAEVAKPAGSGGDVTGAGPTTHGCGTAGGEAADVSFVLLAVAALLWRRGMQS